jgi:flagellar hook-length control protein FliK
VETGATRVPEGSAFQVPAEPATLGSLGNHAVRGVHYLLSRGESTMTVRLVPASLGEVHFEVHGSGDDIRIRVSSANPTVREAMEQQIPMLRQALAQEGIEVSRVDVTARMSFGTEQGAHTGGRQTDPQGAPVPGRGPGPPGYSTGGQSGSGTRQQRSTSHAGTLDVFV